MKSLLPLAIVIGALSIPTQAIAGHSSKHDAVVSYFISSEEPSVKDAMWSTETTLKLGMLDNRRNRDGFANYACNILYEHGFKGKRVTVHIIDIRKLVRKNKWELHT